MRPVPTVRGVFGAAACVLALSAASSASAQPVELRAQLWTGDPFFGVTVCHDTGCSTGLIDDPRVVTSRTDASGRVTFDAEPGQRYEIFWRTAVHRIGVTPKSVKTFALGDDTSATMVFGPYLTPGDHPGQSAEEAAIVQGVNEQRALVGAPPLIADKKLFGAADMQAAWMRRTQRVPTPDDPDSWGEEQSSHYERARHYGFIEELYTGRLAETVAHQVDGPTTLAAWMQNADDRSRLLDPRWRYIGVGADATSYAATLAEYDTMCQKASCGPPAYDGGATPLIAPPAQLPPPQAPPRSAPACAPRWRTAPTARRLSRTRVRLTLRVRCAGRTTRPVVRVGGRARGRTVRLRMRRTQTVVTTAKTLRVALRTGRSTARWVVVRVAPRR